MRKAWLLCSALGLIYSCEERLPVTFDGAFEPEWIIRGLINQSTGPYTISIQSTNQGRTPPEPVDNACVVLYDVDNDLEEDCYYDGIGAYQCPGLIVTGRPGGSYYIRVMLASGEVFGSAVETMPTNLARDQLSFELGKKRIVSSQGIETTVDAMQFHLTSQIPQVNEPHYFAWFAEETFKFLMTDFPDPFGSVPPPCYITQPIGGERVNLLTTSQFTGRIHEVRDMFSKGINKAFLSKHIFTVYHHSVTRAQFDYLNQLKVLAENQGSLFDAPPGQPVGNIASEDNGQVALGYFAAALTDTTRIAVFPDDIQGIFVQDDCEFDASRRFDRYSALCRNCLNVPRSSYHRPAFYDTTN